MDRRLWLRIILVCLSSASVCAVQCVKKYEDETVKIFNCSECCGGVYTRYCCQPPLPKEEPESEFSASIIAVIIISVVIIIALVIAIALCAAWYFCDCFGSQSPLEPYKHQPPPVVVHKVENNDNFGLNDEEFHGISENYDNFDYPTSTLDHGIGLTAR